MLLANLPTGAITGAQLSHRAIGRRHFVTFWSQSSNWDYSREEDPSEFEGKFKSMLNPCCQLIFRSYIPLYIISYMPLSIISSLAFLSVSPAINTMPCPYSPPPSPPPLNYHKRPFIALPWQEVTGSPAPPDKWVGGRKVWLPAALALP